MGPSGATAVAARAPTLDPSVTNIAPTPLAGFIAGLKAALPSVFLLVLVGTYISIGALAHDLGFSVLWVVLSTVLVWAAPAQVIILTSLGAGAAPLEIAIAVSLSAMRLLPMVVSILPMLRTPATKLRGVILLAHFTAVSMWVEVLRLAPALPREARIGFANGIGTVFMGGAATACVLGFYLAAALPSLLVGALLFLTPMSFLVSVTRGARVLSDRLAFVLGLGIGPLIAYQQIGLDLLWTGLLGGSAAYALARLRRALR